MFCLLYETTGENLHITVSNITPDIVFIIQKYASPLITLIKTRMI